MNKNNTNHLAYSYGNTLMESQVIFVQCCCLECNISTDRDTERLFMAT